MVENLGAAFLEMGKYPAGRPAISIALDLQISESLVRAELVRAENLGYLRREGSWFFLTPAGQSAVERMRQAAAELID